MCGDLFADGLPRLTDWFQAPSCAPKQLSKKFAFTVPWVFGSLRVALLFSVFYFDTGAYKLLDLIWDKQEPLAELSIYIVAWISVPNESYNFEEKLAVSPEGWVTCLQERKRRVAHSRIF
jgi:hypothetical protein